MARLCFDLDGTLCTATGGDYERAEPLPWAIARVNALSRAGHEITIFTARGTATGIDWSEVTQAQLQRWGVRYDALRFGKPSADVYIDDRAVHSETWCVGDGFRPPGLPRAQEADASDLFADLPVAAPAPIRVVEFGRTFGGEPRHLDWHLERAGQLAAAVGIGPLAPAERIGALVEEALRECRGDADVVFSISIAQPGHVSLPDSWGRRGEAPVEISCRALEEVASALRPMLAEAESLSIRADLDGHDTTGWPLHVADNTLTSDLGATLCLVVDGALMLAPGQGSPDVAVRWLARIAHRLGLSVTEQPLSLDVLAQATEAFIVGFPFCLLPVGQIGPRQLAGARGPLARKVLEAWGEEAGIDIVAQVAALLGPGRPVPPKKRPSAKGEATVVIPARLRSTRLPEKVLADIGGRPMIEHVYEAATEAACGPVLVLTDAEEVAEAVRGFGGEVWMTDPGHPSGTARIASVIDRLGTDLVVNLQGDAPLIDPEVVALSAAEARASGAPVTMPVYPLEDEISVQDPSVVKVVRAQDGRVLYCSRSAIPHHRESGGAGSGQGSFWAHPGLYAYTSDFLRTFTRLPTSPLEETERLEQLRWLEAGVHIHSFVIRPQQPSVDTPHDLGRIRELYESRVAV